MWKWLHQTKFLLLLLEDEAICKLAAKNLVFRKAAAVEKLIRRCHNVDISNDRGQDVRINTQMLNGWRMSE